MSVDEAVREKEKRRHPSKNHKHDIFGTWGKKQEKKPKLMFVEKSERQEPWEELSQQNVRRWTMDRGKQWVLGGHSSDQGASLSHIRSGHGPASTGTVLTAFLVTSRKKTGIKRKKNIEILRNNIWHSSITSEKLQSDEMMF